MQYLTQVAAGVDTRPIREALACNEDFWYLARRRVLVDTRPSGTHTIFLRGPDRTGVPPTVFDEEIHPSRIAPHAWRLPEPLLLAQTLAEDLGGELCRALLVRLPPGGTVGTHRDYGAYFAIRNRYHLAIANEPNGSLLRVRDEEVDLPLGSVWQIANKEPHAARNRSNADRIHLIFDLLPPMAARRRETRAERHPTLTGSKLNETNQTP